MEYGLTDRGFIVKPFEEILKEEQANFRTAFGNDIDLSDTGIQGVYVRNLSLKFSQLWEQLGKLYAIGDVDDSFGIYLDRITNFVNVPRLEASKTRVYVCLWASEGTPILTGHLLRLATGQTFRITEAATVSKSSLLGFLLSVSDVISGHTYQLQINSTNITYTALEDDEEEQIFEGISTAIENAFQDVFEKEITDDGLLVHSRIGLEAFSISSSDTSIEFPLLGFYAVYLATRTGAIIVPIRALNEIVNKENGLESAVNYAAGITGRNVESDTELRMNLGTRQKQAKGNEIAIQNEIRKVPGVKYVRVYSNRDITERNGRPPKSYETVVVDGDEQDIAEKIFETGPAGIEPFGNINKDVFDAEGFRWVIGFSRPTNKYIWIKIIFSQNQEEDLPMNFISSIQENIIKWGQNTLDVGVDLIFQRLFRPVYDVQGIGYAEIKVAVTTDLIQPLPEDYESRNIVIGETEMAVIDTSRIEVQEIS